MKIYRLSEAGIRVVSNKMEDRTQYILMDEAEAIGKLTIQSNLSPNYYIMTYFKIDDPKKRRKGLGSILMKYALNDLKYFDRPLILKPSPFEGEDIIAVGA